MPSDTLPEMKLYQNPFPGYRLVRTIFSPTGDSFFCFGTRVPKSDLHLLNFETRVGGSPDLSPGKIEKLAGFTRETDFSVATYSSTGTSFRIVVADLRGQVLVIWPDRA